MAGVDRMTIEEVVRKVLVEDHADVIRESVRWVAEQMMESEVSELVGAELGERRPGGSSDPSQRVSSAGGGIPGLGRLSCRSPSSGRTVISRRSCSLASALSRRWSRSSSRRMCVASRHGGSTSWSNR